MLAQNSVLTGPCGAVTQTGGWCSASAAPSPACPGAHVRCWIVCRASLLACIIRHTMYCSLQLMEGGNLFQRIYDRCKRRMSYLEILQVRGAGSVQRLLRWQGLSSMGLHIAKMRHGNPGSYCMPRHAFCSPQQFSCLLCRWHKTWLLGWPTCTPLWCTATSSRRWGGRHGWCCAQLHGSSQHRTVH